MQQPDDAGAVAVEDGSTAAGTWSTSERAARDQQGRAAARPSRPTWVDRVWQLAILVAAVIIWQLVTANHLLSPILNATPAQVWDSFTQLARTGQLWNATEASMAAVLLAFALAVVIGAPIGIGLALLPRVERIVSPFIDALNATPRVILAPVFIVAFGIGTSAKVAVGFSLCIFIMIVNARSGVRAVDEDVVLLATSLGAKKREIFAKVLWPAAIPGVFAGMRLSLIFAIFGVVASELISSTSGLGYLAAKYSNEFQMSAVYAVLIAIMILGSVLNILMRMAERRLMRWRQGGAEL
jgi:NitT/TauT family transport system permease protein